MDSLRVVRREVFELLPYRGPAKLRLSSFLCLQVLCAEAQRVARHARCPASPLVSAPLRGNLKEFSSFFFGQLNFLTVVAPLWLGRA